MRNSLFYLVLAFGLPGAASLAQSAPAPHTKPTVIGTPARLPPFSGTWILDTKRSQLPQKINGESKAVIEYDGKTWHYIHSHQETSADEPDQWQTRMTVGSPKYDTAEGIDITFHSRIAREGNAMVLSEYGVTSRGQKTRNTVRYTLEEDGMTLIELETMTGPLGTQHNRYVLQREGSLPK